MIYSPEQNILDNLPLSPRSGFGVCYNFHVCKSAAQVTDVLPEMVDTVFSSKEEKAEEWLTWNYKWKQPSHYRGNFTIPSVFSLTFSYVYQPLAQW